MAREERKSAVDRAESMISGIFDSPRDPMAAIPQGMVDTGSDPRYMSLGPPGEQLIKGYEKLRLNTYDDGYGNPTIGWGHRVYGPQSPITKPKADELFQSDVAKVQQAIADSVKVPLTQSQFDTLVSFGINTGTKPIEQIAKTLNSGDYQGAIDRMGQYTKADGQHSRGLVNRRDAEADMWSGAPAAQTYADNSRELRSQQARMGPPSNAPPTTAPNAIANIFNGPQSSPQAPSPAPFNMVRPQGPLGSNSPATQTASKAPAAPDFDKMEREGTLQNWIDTKKAQVGEYTTRKIAENPGNTALYHTLTKQMADVGMNIDGSKLEAPARPANPLQSPMSSMVRPSGPPGAFPPAPPMPLNPASMVRPGGVPTGFPSAPPSLPPPPTAATGNLASSMPPPTAATGNTMPSPLGLPNMVRPQGPPGSLPASRGAPIDLSQGFASHYPSEVPRAPAAPVTSMVRPEGPLGGFPGAPPPLQTQAAAGPPMPAPSASASIPDFAGPFSLDAGAYASPAQRMAVGSAGPLPPAPPPLSGTAMAGPPPPSPSASAPPLTQSYFPGKEADDLGIGLPKPPTPTIPTPVPTTAMGPPANNIDETLAFGGIKPTLPSTFSGPQKPKAVMGPTPFGPPMPSPLAIPPPQLASLGPPPPIKSAPPSMPAPPLPKPEDTKKRAQTLVKLQSILPQVHPSFLSALLNSTSGAFNRDGGGYGSAGSGGGYGGGGYQPGQYGGYGGSGIGEGTGGAYRNR